jgi:hypothetical protein
MATYRVLGNDLSLLISNALDYIIYSRGIPVANPSSVGLTDNDYVPALIATSTTPVVLTVNPNKQYLLYHTGLAAADGATGETDAVMLGFNGTTAAVGGGAATGLLVSTQRMVIGPGLTSIALDAVANTPAVLVAPMRNDLGAH